MNTKLINSMKNEHADTPVHQRPDFNYIILGGALLAACAGFVNVVFMNHVAYTVSHNTGITSRMAINFGKFDISQALFGFFIILCYFSGAATVGFFQNKEKFYYSRKYGFFLITEATLLTIATILFSYKDETYSVLVASYSMGLQNGLFTNFSGAVVRTTHVTGLLTDVGLIIGHKIRGREKSSDLWRLKVLFPLLIGFIIGGIVSTITYFIWNFYCMCIPIVILYVGGIVWTYWRLSAKDKEIAEEIKILENSTNV